MRLFTLLTLLLASCSVDTAGVSLQQSATPTCDGIETCDGIDNDCDLSTEDGSADQSLGKACDGDDADLCKDGKIVCESGMLKCSDSAEANTEICDGVDNDCDPSTPDGLDEDRYNKSCGAGQGTCSAPVWLCVNGTLACQADGARGPEICDGIDNDCDPSTADGVDDPGLHQPCDGKDPDLCEYGTLGCLSGRLACFESPSNTRELCDGIDNDCDPMTVDGAAEPAFGESCDSDDADLCSNGVSTCRDGSMVCDGDINRLDVCDGIDNDCDPSTPDGTGEEGFSDSCGAASETCDARLSCVGGLLECSASSSSPETCNAQDDDCDGSIDEGGVCPCLQAEFDGNSYLFCSGSNTQSWTDAANVCEAARYQLVRIETPEENAFLASQIRFDSWTALNDAMDEGTFSWDAEIEFIWTGGLPPNGRAVDGAYTNFDAGEPNNGNNSDCVRLRSNGKWRDTKCSERLAFICESTSS